MALNGTYYRRYMANIGTGPVGTMVQGDGPGNSVKFSQATYPTSAGAIGNVLSSDGLNFVSAPPVSTSQTGLAVYGDGSDGSPTFDGVTTILGMAPAGGTTYTLTRDFYFASPIINTGVSIITAGFRVFVNGTLTNNGTIQYNGLPGNSAGAMGGAQQNANSTFNPLIVASEQISTRGGAGAAGAGNAGITGTVSYGYGGLGQAGGSGTSAGGGASSQLAIPAGIAGIRTLPNAISGVVYLAGVLK